MSELERVKVYFLLPDGTKMPYDMYIYFFIGRNTKGDYVLEIDSGYGRIKTFSKNFYILEKVNETI